MVSFSKLYKAFQDHLNFLNRHMIVWIGWNSSFSQIYYKCRTAGHLVFWKSLPAVDRKNVSTVTKHHFVFWALTKHFRIAELFLSTYDSLNRWIARLSN